MLESFWSLENKNIKGKWKCGEREAGVRKRERTAEVMVSAEVPSYLSLSPLEGCRVKVTACRELQQGSQSLPLAHERSQSGGFLLLCYYYIIHLGPSTSSSYDPRAQTSQ